MIIRDVKMEDVPAITRIYNEAVENGKAIWNEVVVDEADRREWVRTRTGQGHPLLVVEDDDPESSSFGEVLGYATYTDFRGYHGYRYTVEHSVYLRADTRGKGIAVPLMQELIERARTAGNHVIVAAIEGGNRPSIRLHEKLGFKQVGKMEEVGIKFGEWLDLVLMQLKLNDDAAPGAKEDEIERSTGAH